MSVNPKKLTYCGEIIRANDPDRFLLSMFAPSRVRADVWALFAFNHEVAKTREVVSDTKIGMIRLQWWRDAIQGIYEGDQPPEHEILKPLACAIEQHNLPRELFDTLIYAREFDLEDVLPGNMEGLLNYADFTTTPLMKLAVQIAGDNPDVEIVQPVSLNYALAGLLRAVPFFAGRRQCILPEDLMKAHGQSVNKLYELKCADTLPDIIKSVAGQSVKGLQPDNRLLKATNALSMIYFKQLRACGYDVFHPRMALEPPFKALRLVFHSI